MAQARVVFDPEKNVYVIYKKSVTWRSCFFPVWAKVTYTDYSTIRTRSFDSVIEAKEYARECCVDFIVSSRVPEKNK